MAETVIKIPFEIEASLKTALSRRE